MASFQFQEGGGGSRKELVQERRRSPRKGGVGLEKKTRRRGDRRMRDTATNARIEQSCVLTIN